MHKRTTLLSKTLLIVIACVLPAGGASANRSIEIRGGSRIQVEGKVQFTGEGASTEITCDLTILRTVATAVPKINGTQFGKVTGIHMDRGETARSPRCRHGSFIREMHDIIPLSTSGTPCTHTENRAGILTWNCSGAPASLWKLIYDSFQGTLPGITGVNVHIQGEQINFILLEPFGGTIECLYEGDVYGLLIIRQPESTANSANAVTERTRLARIRGSAFCPATGMGGSGFTVRPTLTIRLI